MAKEISVTAILFVLLLGLIVISQMHVQTTAVGVKIYNDEIIDVQILNINITNANKWFNSYPSGKYELFLSYDNQTLKLENFESKYVTFYLGSSPNCVLLQLYWNSILMDSKKVCK